MSDMTDTGAMEACLAIEKEINRRLEGYRKERQTAAIGRVILELESLRSKVKSSYEYYQNR